MKLNDAIRSIIKMCNKTQNEVAKDIGTTQGALATMFMRNNMQVQTLITIADDLGYEVVLRPKSGTNKSERTVVIDSAGK